MKEKNRNKIKLTEKIEKIRGEVVIIDEKN